MLQCAHSGCCAGLPGTVITDQWPSFAALASSNTTYGFISGIHPGTPVHVLLSPGACNTTVVSNVIVPDYLPPTFTNIRRNESSVQSELASIAAGLDVRS